MITLETMPPLMFGGLVVAMLIGFPVAFTLAAVGLSFGFLAIHLGFFDMNFLQAIPGRVFGSVLSNELLLAIPFFTFMGAILVMFGASYTFKRNEHVRVEIFYLFLSERGQLWLDMIGTLFFLIPACLLLAYLSWPFFMQAYAVGEMSGNAGGLIRWPIKFVIPAGFVLLALQGVSEVIKRVAALQGELTIDANYERPTQ